MKNKLTKYVLGILAITFTLISCSKNEDALATVASTKQDILTFKTVEEFNTTVQKVNTMKPEERSEWEKSNGFKSFGTICDEFYKTIEPQNFKNIEEVNDFVAKNSDKIQIFTNAAGDKYCDVQEFDNSARYLMNKDKMYIVGSTVVRQFAEGTVSTDIANIDLLKNAKNYSDLDVSIASHAYKVMKTIDPNSNASSTDVYDENDVYDGWFGAKQTYRLLVRLKVENTYDGYNTYDHHLIQVTNYVWHIILFGVSRTTSYNIGMYVTDIAFGNLYFHPIRSNANYVGYDAVNDSPFIAGGSVNSQIRITIYNVVASNDKGCSISESHTY